MASQTKPDVNTIWAETGEVEPIPEDKQKLGYIEEIPFYDNFNWLMQQFSMFLKHTNQEGVAVWDNKTLYPVAGLAKSPVDGQIYRALEENSNTPPIAGGVVNPKWLRWGFTAAEITAQVNSRLNASFPFRGRAVFNTPGVQSWTLPEGVTRVFVEVVGAGGGGARSNVAPGPAGGGGGGLAKKLVVLPAGSTVTLTVGTGGSGGATLNAVGTAGTASSFNTGDPGTTVSAGGGGGGTNTANSADGGIGTGGDENYSVGPGGVASRRSDGNSLLGGAGGGGESVAAIAGSARPTRPGQGGGGRVDTAAAPGAHGSIILTW